MITEEHILTHAKEFVNGLVNGRASMPAMPVHEWTMFMTLVREQIRQRNLAIH
ncbi:succinate dehydrogenase flavoprotein subunit (plasmid) [Pantoea sp. SGAir0184]|nr:succinate dehydrogenase flavoprotein subunit [Enterobacter roggenkampii]